MRISQRDVNRMQLRSMAELSPIGCNHIGGSRHARRTTELRHDLAAGVSALRTAGVFGVGQYLLLPCAETHGLFERPGTVRVEGDPRLWKVLCQCSDSLDLLCARKHPTLQFEVAKSVTSLRRCGQLQNGVGVQRLLMP